MSDKIKPWDSIIEEEKRAAIDAVAATLPEHVVYRDDEGRFVVSLEHFIEWATPLLLSIESSEARHD